MRNELFVSVFSLGLGLVAQTQQLPLPAYSNTYTSTSTTRGFYFQTPVPITILGLRVPDEGAAGVQNVEVSLLASAPPAYPATASGGQVFYAANVPSSYVIPCQLDFPAGAWIGVMGGCGTSTLKMSYGPGEFATSIGGQSTTLHRFITQTNLNSGGGQPYAADGVGSIGRVEVYYTTPQPPPRLAQPPFDSTFTSPGLTRGFYFQTPVPIILRGLRVPDESGQGTQVVEVSRSAVAPPVYPATGNLQQVFYASGQPSYAIIPCFVPFQAGDFVTILGGCGTTTMNTSYSNATAAPYVVTIGGTPTALNRAGIQYNLHTTGGSQPVWSQTSGNLGRVEVYFELATGLASAETYGLGCVRKSRSFYEVMPASSFDLANSAMTLSLVGNRYVASAGGTYVAPTAAAQVLALGDDTEVVVNLSGGAFPFAGGNTTSLVVCTNGYVSTALGNSIEIGPDPFYWTHSLNPRWGTVHDFDPTRVGSGQVKFEQVGMRAYVTWDAVYTYGNSQPGTCQLQFDLSTGQVRYVWRMMANVGSGYLVGFAAAGTSLDTGGIDISVRLPGGFSTSLLDEVGLQLASAQRPVVGTTISLQTTNIPFGAPFGASLLGLQDRSIDLAGLGAPGCTQYVDPLATNVFLIGGSSSSLPFLVPNNPFLLGVNVYAQSAAYAVGSNALGVVFSNGLHLAIDLL